MMNHLLLSPNHCYQLNKHSRVKEKPNEQKISGIMLPNKKNHDTKPHLPFVHTLTVTSIHLINLHSTQSKKHMKSFEHIANKIPPKIRSAENGGRIFFFS